MRGPFSFGGTGFGAPVPLVCGVGFPGRLPRLVVFGLHPRALASGRESVSGNCLTRFKSCPRYQMKEGPLLGGLFHLEGSRICCEGTLAQRSRLPRCLRAVPYCWATRCLLIFERVDCAEHCSSRFKSCPRYQSKKALLVGGPFSFGREQDLLRCRGCLGWAAAPWDRPGNGSRGYTTQTDARAICGGGALLDSVQILPPLPNKRSRFHSRDRLFVCDLPCIRIRLGG